MKHFNWGLIGAVLFCIVFWICAIVCFAEDYNPKYSFKDFTNFVMTDAKDIDGVVAGSCFYQEGVPNRRIFPEDMKGVTFKRCNLVNVFIPPGNTVEDCQIGNILVQKDWSDWKLDKDLKPVEPLDKEERQKLGISCDPKDIPVVKMTEYILDKKRTELATVIE